MHKMIFKKLLVFLALSGCVFSLPKEKDPFVVVIGAGSAGIAAASKLYEKKINVTVLEAEDRIGGRINSVKFGDAFVDLGAEWCHGEKNNVVYEMVKDLNVLNSDKLLEKYFLFNGSVFNEQLAAKLSAVNHKLYFTDDIDEDGISMGEYFQKKIKGELTKMYGDNTEDYKTASLLVETFKKFILMCEGTFSLFSPSARSDYLELEGNQQLNWNGKGYKTVLEIMLKKFPQKDPDFKLEEQIQKHKEVKKVEMKDDHVDVTCDDGTILRADHVIFTPSLGVLKHNHKTLFEPKLDNDKAVAIENLGFDGVTKVMCLFEKRWWNEENTGFYFVWDPSEQKKLPTLFNKGPIKNGTSWLTNFVGVMPLKENPKVLSAWFAGAFVPEIEKMSTDVLQEGITFALTKYLGKKYEISKLEQTIMKPWYSCDHFKGIYSFQTLVSRKAQTSPSSNEILAKPIVATDGTPRILFAGEATNPTHYATVHGAIETGFREAERIISLYKK